MAINQLLLSKYLFSKGQEFLKKDDEISCGIAVSLFQDASEILLRAIAKHVDADVGENEAYLQYWEKIKKARKGNNKEVPNKAQMTDVNKARVSFKHYGHTPNSTLAFQLSAYTEGFLRESMSIFFEVNYDEISLADLIKNERIRTKIKTAEKAYAEKQYKDCVTACAIAEAVASLKLNDLLPKSRSESKKNNIDFDGWDPFQSRLRELIDALIADLSNQKFLIIAALLNINLADIIKFKDIAPNVNVAYSEDQEYVNGVHYKDSDNLDDKDASFCLKFATNYALVVENKIADIEHDSLWRYYHW